MPMDQQWFISFREKLDQHYEWPALYIFKFIVPKGKEQQVKDLFPGRTTTDRPSRQGNYISLSVEMVMLSSDAVVEIYERASHIEGIVAL
jgi:putative lipoic acid-binding regulatory protein